MTITELNLNSHPYKRITGKASINIDQTKGIFVLAKSAAEKIGLNPGSKIVFWISADADIYITRTYSVEGFPLRATSSNCLMFNNISLARKLLPAGANKVKAEIGEGVEINGRLCFPLLNMTEYK